MPNANINQQNEPSKASRLVTRAMNYLGTGTERVNRVGQFMKKHKLGDVSNPYDVVKLHEYLFKNKYLTTGIANSFVTNDTVGAVDKAIQEGEAPRVHVSGLLTDAQRFANTYNNQKEDLYNIVNSKATTTGATTGIGQPSGSQLASQDKSAASNLVTSYGMSPDRVREIQNALQQAGYKDTKVDGLYGNQTRANTMKLQRILNEQQLYNGPIDGIWGSGTEEAWKKYDGNPANSSSTTVSSEPSSINPKASVDRRPQSVWTTDNSKTAFENMRNGFMGELQSKINPVGIPLNRQERRLARRQLRS